MGIITTIFVLITVATAGTAGYLTLRGYTAPCPPAHFQPLLDSSHVFEAPAAQVLAAYERAVSATGGMSVYARSEGVIFIDSRPSMLVLNGDYGSSMRLTVGHNEPGRTTVKLDYLPKTQWVSTWTDLDAAFAAKERALRMNAKRLGGIREYIRV